jgi:hypothetical protein
MWPGDGECAEPVVRGGDRLSPGPGRVDVQDPAAGGAHEPSGGQRCGGGGADPPRAQAHRRMALKWFLSSPGLRPGLSRQPPAQPLCSVHPGLERRLDATTKSDLLVPSPGSPQPGSARQAMPASDRCRVAAQGVATPRREAFGTAASEQDTVVASRAKPSRAANALSPPGSPAGDGACP